MPKSCYECRTRAARKDSLFCTQKCAADWAEEFARGNGDIWDEDRCEWIEAPPGDYTGIRGTT